jgi:GxxExxY protein
MHANERELDQLVTETVGAAYEVANILGSGFLEKVYHRALVKELTLRGLHVRSEVQFPVHYKGQHVGDYVADIVVDGRLIVELKCAEALSSEHMAQCINYLKASGLKLALLINFQHPKVEWKRIIRS